MLGGCSEGARPAPADKPAVAQPLETRFPVRIGARDTRLQVALRQTEQTRGLMERQSLEPDEGMLFVFPRQQKMSFWMRNTPLPLDIGYFDSEGILREVYPLFPHDERAVVSVAQNLQFAVEMRQGWFREHGVRPGDRLDLAAVRAAITARGMQPAAFGLAPP
jgi:uncharacterized membrane protein (UPF0127 family)